MQFNFEQTSTVNIFIAFIRSDNNRGGWRTTGSVIAASIKKKCTQQHTTIHNTNKRQPQPIRKTTRKTALHIL